MDAYGILAQLTIPSLERLAAAVSRRRGRPPAWLKAHSQNPGTPGPASSGGGHGSSGGGSGTPLPSYRAPSVEDTPHKITAHTDESGSQELS